MRISDWSSDVCSSDLRIDADTAAHAALNDRLAADAAAPEQQFTMQTENHPGEASIFIDRAEYLQRLRMDVNAMHGATLPDQHARRGMRCARQLIGVQHRARQIGRAHV